MSAIPENPIEVSIVVPVYNEQECLPKLDAEIRQMLEDLDKPAEIIYIDDGSKDGSLQILLGLLREAAAKGIPTRVIRLRRNFGQTAALAAGFQHAQGRIVCPLDADGQNNPRDIPRLLERIDSGCDVVSGWRRHRKDKILSRRLPSSVANWLISKISGVPLHDYGCTLKAYRASLLKEVRLYGDMHRFLPLYLAGVGARVTELEVDHRPRLGGISKYSGRRIPKVLLDLVLVRFMSKYYNRPMHFFGQLALAFLLAALLTGFFMVAFKFGWLRGVGIDYQASFIQTPLPALAATFILGSITSLFFGVLSEILIRIHHESRGSEPYAIEAILDSRGSLPEDPCAE